LLGVGIDYATIDPEKCAPGIYGETKYPDGQLPCVIHQMLSMAGIFGQYHPGQKPEELLVAADDLENCPYVGDESRDSFFLDWHFNKKYPDLAKYCDVDRTVQD
jgi:hypothetical protein